uniref:Urease accessory protein F-like n=1 Tax=Saccoglossus kowalevskii TaxID=10224 RepID=A0ABM0LZZ2_SACKO|nr:PREDICTED: urease accessory protein F-like [Saccoglossus kowalevskii]
MGLEAAFQQGHIKGIKQFENFVVGCLENSGSLMLPFVISGYEHSGDVDEIQQYDSLCQACLNNHVENRASIRQGNALIHTSCQTFVDSRFQRLEKLLEDGKVKGHYSVMYGCTCHYLGLSKSTCVETFLFGVLRTVVNSAVRLTTIGSMQAQNIQFKCLQYIPDIIERNISRTVDDACISNPLIDIIENTHDNLFSRLFHS